MLYGKDSRVSLFAFKDFANHKFKLSSLLTQQSKKIYILICHNCLEVTNVLKNRFYQQYCLKRGMWISILFQYTVPQMEFGTHSQIEKVLCYIFCYQTVLLLVETSAAQSTESKKVFKAEGLHLFSLNAKVLI